MAVTGDTPLWENAKCRGGDREKFFPERGTAQVTARDSKAVCNGEDGTGVVCQERSVCLEYALSNKERFGIWGGMSERERARVAKRRRVEAKQRELEVEQRKEARAAAARRGWEKRRTREVEQQTEKAAKVVAIGNKDSRRRATEKAPDRRRRTA